LEKDSDRQSAVATVGELTSSFEHGVAMGTAVARHPTGMIWGLGTIKTSEAVTGMGAAPLAIAETFVDAIIKLELDSSRDIVARHGTTRHVVYPDGRAGSTFTHEFFPYDVPAADAIRFAQSLAGRSLHLISPMGKRIRTEMGIYEMAGYEQVGEWTLMIRPLTERISELGDERAALIEDAATEDRVVSTILATGESQHLTRSGHAAYPAIGQRWILDGREPASFGRMVLLGITRTWVTWRPCPRIVAAATPPRSCAAFWTTRSRPARRPASSPPRRWRMVCTSGSDSGT
jgi:hypothetical protein